MVFAKTNTRHPLYNGVYAVITTNVPVEFKPEACPFIRGILRLAERHSVQLKYAPPYIYIYLRPRSPVSDFRRVRRNKTFARIYEIAYNNIIRSVRRPIVGPTTQAISLSRVLVFTAWTATKTVSCESSWRARRTRPVAGWPDGFNRSPSSSRTRASCRCPRPKSGADGRPNSPSGPATNTVTWFSPPALR